MASKPLTVPIIRNHQNHIFLKEETKPGFHLKCIIKCRNFWKIRKHEVKACGHACMHSLHVDNWDKSLQVRDHELHGEVQMGI